MAVVPPSSRAGPWPRSLPRAGSLLVLMLVLVLAPGSRAVGVLGEAVAPLHRWVCRAYGPIGITMVGARAAGSQGVGLPMVGHGRWAVGGGGRCRHQAADGGGLGAGQRAHRRDGRGGAVVVEVPLRVERALFTGPVGTPAHGPLRHFVEEQKQPKQPARDY